EQAGPAAVPQDTGPSPTAAPEPPPFFTRRAGLVLHKVDSRTLERLPGFTPLSLGEHHSYRLGPDNRTLAAIVHPEEPGKQPGRLYLIDLHTWSVTDTGRSVDAPAGWLTLSPDGEDLYWTEGEWETEQTLYRYRIGGASPERVAEGRFRDLFWGPDGGLYWTQERTELERDLYSYDTASKGSRLLATIPAELGWLQALPSGRIVAYGTPESGDEVRLEWPRLMLIDAEGVAAELTLEGVTSGSLPSEDLPMDRSYQPGLAWDLERSLLYVVHADQDALTVVDLDLGRIVRYQELAAPLSALQRVLAWLVPTAQAKGPWPGVTRRAALSPDGSRLYLSGQTGELRAEGGEFVEEPQGLRVIDTESLEEVGRADLPVDSLVLSPDGGLIVATGSRVHSSEAEGWQTRHFGLYLLDASSLEVLAHLEPEQGFWLGDFSSGGHYLYLTLKDSETMRVLDLITQDPRSGRRGWASDLLWRAGVVEEWVEECMSCPPPMGGWDEPWPFRLPSGYEPPGETEANRQPGGLD
ncbi:MAG: hypothetical protein ACRDXD_05805, partial [Acidimicrobiia bacterium]